MDAIHREVAQALGPEGATVAHTAIQDAPRVRQLPAVAPDRFADIQEVVWFDLPQSVGNEASPMRSVPAEQRAPPCPVPRQLDRHQGIE